MPTAHNGDVALQYAVSGAGPTVAFLGDVGVGAWLWSYQLGGLPSSVETLVWDYRGTGDSDGPPGPYSVGDLAADLEAVLADHGADSVHLVGSGLGGVVGIEYARRSGRVETLTTFGTPRSPEDVDRAALERLEAPRDDPEALRESLRAAFTPGVVDSHAAEIDRIVGWRREDDADAAGWTAQREALLSAELTDLYEVTVPTLVCHGVDDAIVDPSASERLAEDLPRGRYQAVEGGHFCFVESAQAVTDELLDVVEAAE